MTASTAKRVLLHVAPPIARIDFNHPPLNIIDVPFMEQLASALEEVESHAGISVVVFSGSDNAFSSGVDVAAHAPDKVEEMLTKFHAVFRSMVASRKVLVAAVRGHCLGGGAELTLLCDLVVTSESATWGFPEISLGCFPPVAATALATVIGQKQAAELILTGRKIDGHQARVLGLANSAVPDQQVASEAVGLAKQLATLSQAALAATKKAMYAWDSMHFDKGLARAEKIYLEELMKTDDAGEGIQAFLEKREPKWTGK